ncbi:MAG TPA: hypothetical protein DHV36_09550 [Desulfobacteraceae bacterium]|nr:hypothetical protein [Desulfobacteraceae bacterium]|tara:strand:- start:1997 stop:2728 length:732 start_codon:yes stop_codon:yes gene_type:complete
MEIIIRESPLPFSPPMVVATLNELKNQTRRVFKGNTSGEFESICRVTKGLPKNQLNRWGAMFREDCPSGPIRHFTPSPYGGPGDFLYVREMWKPYLNDQGSEGFTRIILFPADNESIPVPEQYYGWFDDKEKLGYHGRPSIHLPKWASRIWLRVKGLRVERLQDITETDAVAEGIQAYVYEYGSLGYGTQKLALGAMHHNAVGAFSFLWDLINGSRGYGWDENPWVWVVEFERVDRPQTAKEA